ncbi:peptidoglycan-binding domain-containing protein [Nitrosomonas communis]|nr:peptidoglycan-binding domain-containing protein [Nitrosomonas communis]
MRPAGLRPAAYRRPGSSSQPKSRGNYPFHKPFGKYRRWPGGVITAPHVCTCPAPNCPRHGSEYVRWVQSSLNQIMNLRLAVTGIMDVPTRSALRSFQEKQGLPVDGIAGPESKDALIGAKSGKLSGIGATKPAEPAMPEPAEPASTNPAAEFKFEWETFSDEFEDAEEMTEAEPEWLGSEWEETLDPEITMLSDGALDGWPGEWEVGRDASLAAIAEQIAARRPISVSAMELEEEKPARRWTRCFKGADVERVRKVYQDNTIAAGANSVDRASCIVMFNVALGQLLKLKTKESQARSKSSRKVQMGALTTETIEKAMAQLRTAGFARPAISIDFFDRRNKTAGTLRPERLKKSVQKAVLNLSTVKGCWYAYGLSIMDGYHSVLLLIDKTGNDGKIYWLDQFSSDIDDDVTTTLDQRITTKTQGWWQAVKDRKNVGYNTPARVWPLRKLISS